ncbi:MAG: hypothetical protein ABR986_02435 [Methanomassiliicoccales archaeon]|jgi:hypothetical protein
MNKKLQLSAVALAMAFFIVVSIILGAGLLDKENATGGMGTRWKMDLNTNQGQNVYHYNSTISTVLVNDVNAMEIKCIDANGNVIWMHPYSSSSIFKFLGNAFYIIDKHNGTSMMDCREVDGTLIWSLTEPGIDGCEVGRNGNYYVHVSNDSRTDAILCVDHDGSVRWKYSDNATLRLWADCNDGTTILRRDNSSVYMTFNGFTVSPMTLPQKLISIASTGTVLGKRNMTLSNYSSFYYRDQMSNGSISVLFEKYTSEDNMFGISATGEMGYTEDLQRNWTIEENHTQPLSSEWTWTIRVGSSNYTFFQSYYNNSVVNSTLTARDADGEFRFEINIKGISPALFYVNGDTVFLTGDPKVVWAIAPDGREYRSDDTDVVWPMGVYGDGLLVQENNSIALISSHGTTEWRYSLGANLINTDFILGNDTIILVTDNAITAIYKPQMSTTMTYVFILMGVDLLVGLLGSMWLVDHWLHRKDGH